MAAVTSCENDGHVTENILLVEAWSVLKALHYGTVLGEGFLPRYLCNPKANPKISKKEAVYNAGGRS